MKLTLNDCLTRINQVLNYPAISYEDVSHFFDQAIAELNTSLKIGLPSVTDMMQEHTITVSDKVLLTTLPSSGELLPHFESLDALKEAEKAEEGEIFTGTYAYICPSSSFINSAFYRKINGDWEKMSKLYGVYYNYADGTENAYIAVPISNDQAVWSPVVLSGTESFYVTDYLTSDWWTLFIIPYVCFKFAVRNNDDGTLFSEEFVQGFQQLQSSYSVPNYVTLVSVAGNDVYKDLVLKNMDNLNSKVMTRAITEDMRVGNSIQPIFGGFYETGGWGV